MLAEEVVGVEEVSVVRQDPRNFEKNFGIVVQQPVAVVVVVIADVMQEGEVWMSNVCGWI